MHPKTDEWLTKPSGSCSSQNWRQLTDDQISDEYFPRRLSLRFHSPLPYSLVLWTQMKCWDWCGSQPRVKWQGSCFTVTFPFLWIFRKEVETPHLSSCERPTKVSSVTLITGDFWVCCSRLCAQQRHSSSFAPPSRLFISFLLGRRNRVESGRGGGGKTWNWNSPSWAHSSRIVFMAA